MHKLKLQEMPPVGLEWIQIDLGNVWTAYAAGKVP
jgi:hypothetical protein